VTAAYCFTLGKKQRLERGAQVENLPVLARAGRRGLSGLEAFPAENRSPLRGAEGDGGFPAALRAVRCRLDLSVASGTAALLALAFASLAAFGLIPKILVGEKLLLPCCEHEIGAAIDALEYTILKLWHLPGSCLPLRVPHYPREELI
jgi:hypothetical protein